MLPIYCHSLRLPECILCNCWWNLHGAANHLGSALCVIFKQAAFRPADWLRSICIWRARVKLRAPCLQCSCRLIKHLFTCDKLVQRAAARSENRRLRSTANHSFKGVAYFLGGLDAPFLAARAVLITTPTPVPGGMKFSIDWSGGGFFTSFSFAQASATNAHTLISYTQRKHPRGLCARMSPFRDGNRLAFHNIHFLVILQHLLITLFFPE